MVLKHFSKSDYWQGSLELLQSESIALSGTIESTCPSFVCVQPNNTTVIRIRKLLRRSRLRGEVFSIDLVDREGNSHSFFIDDRRLSMGSDWDILNAQRQPIGKIDGKALNIGGKFVIRIYDTVWAAYKPFYIMIGLFAAMLRYKDDIYKAIEESLKKVQQGETLHLEDSEVKLYQNPRLMRY